MQNFQALTLKAFSQIVLNASVIDKKILMGAGVEKNRSTLGDIKHLDIQTIR